MFATGHIATAWLAARFADGRGPRRAAIVATVAGVLLPDVVDKSILVAKLSPWGRTIGHSVLVWAVALAVCVGVARAKRSDLPLLLAAGGWLHLVVDLLNDLLAGVLYSGWIFSLWFTWPFFNPDLGMVAAGPLIDAPARMTPWEVVVVGLAAILWTLEWRAARSGLRDRAA
jgi:hypothetical protein